MNNEVVNRIIWGLVFVFMYIFAFNVNLYFHLPMYIVLSLFVFLTIYEYVGLTDRGEEGRTFVFSLHVSSQLIVFLAYITLFVYDAEVMAAAGQPVDSVFGVPLVTWQKLTLSTSSMYGVIFFTLLVIFVKQIFTRPLMGAVFSLGTTLLGLCYIAFFGSHLLLLLTKQEGVFLIWFVSTINFMTDTAAYFGGKFFGRHPVGFKVSPNKTYEGYVSGFVFATAAGVAVYYLYQSATGVSELPITLLEAVLIGPFFSFLAVVGDLIESSIKRDARTKDSASLIPGHGGIFDLTDALYVTVPAMFYYITIRDALSAL